jgi:hypothetical protein
MITPSFFVRLICNLLRHVDVVPADDCVLNELAASLGNFLLDFFAVKELLIVAKGHSL